MQTITPDVDQTSRQNSLGNEKKSIAVPKWRKAQPEKILPVNLEKFYTHFTLLIEFQKKYKRDPEHRDEDHKKLYYWVVNMRAKKRNETIPSLFLEKLNSINFIWEKPTLHTSPLFYKTEELIKNGSNIPPGKIVFNWLSREIKRYQNNAQSPEMRIKFEQMLQINQASNLENETVAAIWNKNHKAVLKYKENRSSKGLRKLFDQNQSLKVWFRLLILHNKMGILSEQWIQKLADMQLFEPRKKHSTETKELKWYQYLLDAKEDIEINEKPANSFE